MAFFAWSFICLEAGCGMMRRTKVITLVLHGGIKALPARSSVASWASSNPTSPAFDCALVGTREFDH